MIKHHLAALAVGLWAFGISFAPTFGGALPTPVPNFENSTPSHVQLATVVKKKVIVKKHGDTKKKVVVTKKTTARSGVHVTTVHPRARVVVKTSRPRCKTVVRTVKNHGRTVKTTRRVC